MNSKQLQLTLPKNIKDKEKFTQYMQLMKLTDKSLNNINPQSLVNALATIWDLQLNNTQVRKEIALIPYGDDLQVQIQEDGFLKLLINNTNVVNFQREIITDKHYFNKENNRWEIDPAKIFEPKKIIGYYGLITIKNNLGNNINFIKGMTIKECEDWRDKFSKKDKFGNFSPAWRNSFNAMALKTVIKGIIRDIFKDATISIKNQFIMDKAMQLDQAIVINEDTITYADNPNSNNEKIKIIQDKNNMTEEKLYKDEIMVLDNISIKDNKINTQINVDTLFDDLDLELDKE